MQSDLEARHIIHHRETIIDAIFIFDTPAGHRSRLVILEVFQRPNPSEAHPRRRAHNPQILEQLARPRSRTKDDPIRRVGLAIGFHSYPTSVSTPIDDLGISQNVRPTLHCQPHISGNRYLRTK